jgi:hypothetical protein
VVPLSVPGLIGGEKCCRHNNSATRVANMSSISAISLSRDDSLGPRTDGRV